MKTRSKRSSAKQDFERRLTKLESAFNLGLKMLDQKATVILANAQWPHTVRYLLHEYMDGTISAEDMPRLCRMLRAMECDLDEPEALRLAMGIVLTTIELGHSVRPQKK